MTGLSAFPGTQLEMDLLTIVTRLEQHEAGDEWIIHRILNSDLPRLRSYLSNDILSWRREALAFTAFKL